MAIIDLKVIADNAMRERGLDPGYSEAALRQVEESELPHDDDCEDLRNLLWCSIDNGTGEEVSSKDLDQITAAESGGDGSVTIYVAIADVDAMVPIDSAVDLQAAKNTTTVYTAGKIYPMIHPRFSENLTSLNEGEDRYAVVTEMTFDRDGEVHSHIYRAKVRNHVKLNYDGVGAWLEGKGKLPKALRNKKEIQECIQVQDRIAQQLKEDRRRQGSLELESIEAKAQMEGGKVVDLKGQQRNHATELIENLMVACNGCASRYLKERGFPTFQRIVRQPKYWYKIVEVAHEMNYKLPKEPSSEALERFLESERAADPVRFPDLSLRVLKLLGRGEYVVEMPNEPPIGHFGLAVREYSHSTAPNRRYPDIITQRLLKSALSGDPSPYGKEELADLAQHCSAQEALAQKVERQTQKSAAALMLSEKIGETFPAVVSGVNEQGTWVRLLGYPIEGKLNGKAKLGQQVKVLLTAVNVERGFIDFLLHN